MRTGAEMESLAVKLGRVDPVRLKDPRTRVELASLALELAKQGVMRVNLGLELAAACMAGTASGSLLARDGLKLRQRCLILRKAIEELSEQVAILRQGK
jgi:hypothetical protein